MATLAAQSQTVTPNGSSHPYTCNTCQVAFRSSDLQRTHMQSDWHRYNLKRRVASLPPLTSEMFAEKVLANKASAAATAARAAFEKVCSACQKTYYSENAYRNHLGSQKHRTQALKMQLRDATGSDADTGSVMSSTFSLGEPLETACTMNASGEHTVDRGVQNVVQDFRNASLEDTAPEAAPSDPQAGTNEDGLLQVPLNLCLFCNHPSENLTSNFLHMSKNHGTFVPESEYLVDSEGLFGYLHEKIFDFHQCLYCGQVKHTTGGAQTHMRDMGHCMIPYGTEEEMLEIGDYYDFRGTYFDPEDEEGSDEEEQEGGVKLGVSRATKITAENEAGEQEEIDKDDEDGWESDASSLSSVPTDEITAMPIDDHSHRYKTLDRHRHHSHHDPRPHRNSDGFHSHAHTTPHAVYHDDYELFLPSGRTAGHRSMNKYFRQNLRNYPTPAERSRQRMIENGRHDSDEEMEDASTEHTRGRGRQLVSRADGGLGMVGVDDAKKREVKAVEKRTQKRAQRDQARYQWGNERRSNFQKHYRDPLLQ